MNLIQTLLILGLVFFLYTKKAKIEKFVTNAPPKTVKKTPHWDHNFATKANLRDDVIHAPVLVNYFPMQKPPSVWEKTMNGAVDVARPQFLAKMAKRREIVEEE